MRAFSGGTGRAIYRTEISDRRWIAYDIPGNVGWILYVTTAAIGLFRPAPAAFRAASAIPAVLMLIGVAELIRERIAGLDRALSFPALALGFGALTLGGLLGLGCGVWGMLARFSARQLLAAGGGLLCFVFAGLLLIGYRKRGDRGARPAEKGSEAEE